jgi:hypothetical protein
MLVCALSLRKLHTGPRVQRAPGIPCALRPARAKRSGKSRARGAARTPRRACSFADRSFVLARRKQGSRHARAIAPPELTRGRAVIRRLSVSINFLPFSKRSVHR